MIPLGKGIGNRNCRKVNMTTYLGGLNDITLDRDMGIHLDNITMDGKNY